MRPERIPTPLDQLQQTAYGTAGSSIHHPVAMALFALMWVGAIAWGVVGAFLNTQAAETILRETPEYQCLTVASGEKPKLRWSTLRNLRYANTGFTVGSLIELKGTNCIESGDAISFALLPEGPGDTLTVVRITGGEVKADFRDEGQWADVTDATGSERWRNDGDGYRRISSVQPSTPASTP